MALDGKLTVSLRPIGYKDNEEFWDSHDELEMVKTIQALGKVEDKIDVYDVYCSDSDNEGIFEVN